MLKKKMMSVGLSDRNPTALKEYVAQGRSGLRDGKELQALQAFRQVLKIDMTCHDAIQGSVVALERLADRAEKDQDHHLFISYLEQAHHLQLDDVRLHQRLAKARYDAYTITGYKSGYPIPAHSPSRIDNLVFQGGGIKGLAYIGAMQALSSHIDLNRVKRLGGASAGAITTAFLSVGYTLEEYEQLSSEVDFSSLMDGIYKDQLLRIVGEMDQVKAWGEGVKDDVLRVIETKQHPSKGTLGISHLARSSSHPYAKAMMEAIKKLSKEELGLFPGDVFREDWVEKYFQRKLGIPYATFRELHDLRTKIPEKFGHLKEPYFVGVNIKTGLTEIFSYEFTPDVIISDALRLSMSIPMLFYPHQAHIKTPDGRRIPHPSGYWYVDGGMLDNYPLWLFDKGKYITGDDRENHSLENPYTLGFRLVTGKRFDGYTQRTTSEVELKRNLPSYVMQLVNTIYEKQESDHVKRLEQDRTIYIDYLGMSGIAFDLSDEQQKNLIASGRSAVQEQFPAMTLKDENTMLEAVDRGNTQTVICLATRGILAECVYPDGQTGLDKALQQNAKAMVVTLVKLGARACQRPNTIDGLLQEAKRSGWMDVTGLDVAIDDFQAHHNLKDTSFTRAGMFSLR